MATEDLLMRDIRHGLIHFLQSLERAGVTHLPTPPRIAPAERVEATKQVDASPGVVESQDRQAELNVIAEKVAACTRCSQLVSCRTQTVFGVGDPAARLCFLGEAPGADEDRLGEPFVGAAGQLLTKIIENGMRLRRKDVYILNILKCRPPGNRTPTSEEAENCREYLEAQLAVIQPEFICCLGSCAAQNLLGTTQSVGRLRGRFHDYHGVRVVCTYHPAYLLPSRNPAAKKQVWEDIQMLMREMGLPVEDH